MGKSAKLLYDGKEIELPLLTGTENEDAIDISKIRSETGLITLDKGYKNTGATTSKITYLDGEKGILRHRGYSIEELASKSSFTESGYKISVTLAVLIKTFSTIIFSHLSGKICCKFFVVIQAFALVFEACN